MDTDLMAFRFTGTEVFSAPIGRKAIQEMWLAERGTLPRFQTPMRVPRELFLRLYESGIQGP